MVFESKQPLVHPTNVHCLRGAIPNAGESFQLDYPRAMLVSRAHRQPTPSISNIIQIHMLLCIYKIIFYPTYFFLVLETQSNHNRSPRSHVLLLIHPTSTAHKPIRHVEIGKMLLSLTTIMFFVDRVNNQFYTCFIHPIKEKDPTIGQ